MYNIIFSGYVDNFAFYKFNKFIILIHNIYIDYENTLKTYI